MIRIDTIAVDWQVAYDIEGEKKYGNWFYECFSHPSCIVSSIEYAVLLANKVYFGEQTI